MTAVERMLDRCEETVQYTGRVLLCWLRSTKPHDCYPKPFTLVSLKTSKKKYLRYFQRFIAFVFRAFRMPSGTRRDLIGVRFTKKQLEQLEVIWSHKAWENKDLAQGLWPKRVD